MTVFGRVHALDKVSPHGPFLFHCVSILWGLVLGIIALACLSASLGIPGFQVKGGGGQ